MSQHSPKDLPSFLHQLRSAAPQDLVTVKKEVDPRLELAAVVKKLELEGRYPVILFEKVKGSRFPVVAGVHATRERLALALDSTASRIAEDYLKRRTALVPPVRVESGPAQQVVRTGDQVDLGALPIVTHCEGDAGPYIGAGVVVAKDPTSDVVNLGIYRMMLKGRNRLSLHINRFHHLAELIRRAEARGEGLECAVVIGHHPAFQIASQTRLPITVDSYHEAGALFGGPLPVVAARTVSLDVPAHAEIVLEGKVLPGVLEPEGPFGEFTYYYGSDAEANVVEVSAITHKAEALYLDLHNVHAEHRVLWICPVREANILSKVRDLLPNTRAVSIPSSGAGLHVYVSIMKLREGDGKNALMAAFGADHYAKLVVVVDEDVDVFDEKQVLWAIATRFQADRDLYILPGSHCTVLDPSSYSLTDRFTRTGMTTKWGLDATKTLEVPFPERADGLPREFRDIDLRDYLGG